MATATKKAPAKKAVRSKVTVAPAPAARARVRTVAAEEPEVERVSYFAQGADKEDSDLEFISSGCSVVDEAMAGGFPLGRVVNIVGNQASGKTLLAMEVTANFHITYKDGKSRYAESEEAFDIPYAGALGMPIHLIEFNNPDRPMRTIEDWHADLVRFAEKYPGVPKLYILDSLDALGDDDEQKAAFGADSYGGKKPKLIGQLFRSLVSMLTKERICLVIVSQLRENMSTVPFAPKYKRSGGKALDYYATHILWLTEIGKIVKTIDKVKRIIGVDVKLAVKKNKVGIGYRDVEYPVLYGYGIDDLTASADWLCKNNREAVLAPLGMSKAGYPTLLTKIRNEGGEQAREMRAALAKIVRREWAAIETSFLPVSKKY